MMVSMSKTKRQKNGEIKPRLRRRIKRKPESTSKVIFAVVLMIIVLLVKLTRKGFISPSWMYNIIGIFYSNNTANGKAALKASSSSSMLNKPDEDYLNGQHFPVVIVGAGIAGLTAAKTLEQQQQSQPVLILEATSQWGGRIRSATKRSITNQKSKTDENNNYAYPIDMGASFITNPKWLPMIAGVSSEEKTSTSSYWDWTTTPASEEWKDMGTTAHDMFRNYSWYEFVQDYLVPNHNSESSSSSSNTKIRYNCVVDKIERKSNAEDGKKSIKVSCGPSFSVTADAVLVTIPLPLLQETLQDKEKRQEAQERAAHHRAGDDDDDDNDNDARSQRRTKKKNKKKKKHPPPPNDDIYDDDIDGGDVFRTSGLQFIPPLPSSIQSRIQHHKAKMLPALKIVFEFKHKFYPDYIDILKMEQMMKDDDDVVIHDPPDVGVNPNRVYEYWADSDVRYDPKVPRPLNAKHYLVGQLLGDPAFAYWNAFYGPFRQNDYYRTSEFQDDMAKHLLQEFINYMEPVEGMDEFLIRQNYVGYQMVHWTTETFTPGILDCSKVKWDQKKQKYNQVVSVPHVNGQLFFAGEAFANLPRSRYHGCGQAHGAAISGKKAALQILHHSSSLQKSSSSSEQQQQHSDDTSSSTSMITIPFEDESLVHRDLERFSMVRPEDASDKKFYAQMKHLWNDPSSGDE